MYTYATRLLQDATGPSLRVWGDHAKALLAAVTALRLVRPADQWFAVRPSPTAEPTGNEGRVRIAVAHTFLFTCPWSARRRVQTIVH